LDPRLTPSLFGTRLYYRLRNNRYVLDLDSAMATVGIDGLSFSAATPFGVASSGDTLSYFPKYSPKPSLAVARSGGQPVTIAIRRWETSGEVELEWDELTPAPAGGLRYRLMGLAPSGTYLISMEGGSPQGVRADGSGMLQFTGKSGRGDRRMYRVSAAGE
jgi:hypothetical protein